MIYESNSKKLSIMNSSQALKNKAVIVKTADQNRSFDQRVMGLSYKTWNKQNSF